MRINEIFYSVQGEGLLTGLPTVFVRTGGCNLRCAWCDTKYAYDEAENISMLEVLHKIKRYCCNRICITGGEPLLQAETRELIKGLDGYSISLETNGSIDISGIPDTVLISMDIKCPSSGESEKMDLDNLERLTKKDQVKFVIKDDEDYRFAKNMVDEYRLTARTNVFFVPVGGINAKELVQNILNDCLDVRIGLQTHKLIWDSKTRGV